MTKAELIGEIKKIQKEEQDYQALFKLMLKRSGKDIRSMSDEDKKKFFTAVDKAYKAKTESRLIIHNKQQLNEDSWFPLLFWLINFLASGIIYGYRFFNKALKETEHLKLTKEEAEKLKNDYLNKNISKIAHTITINDTPKTIASKMVEDGSTISYINRIVKNKKLDNPDKAAKDTKDILQKSLEKGFSSPELKSKLGKNK